MSGIINIIIIIIIKINGVKTCAIVDSAAQVTIVRSNLLKNVSNNNQVLGEKVKLKGIGNKNSTVLATKVKDVEIQLGNTTYIWDVFSADISDPMLLGLDFLSEKNCTIDLMKNFLVLPDGIVQAELKKGSSGHKCEVFEVIVSEDTRINSGSLGRVPIKVMNSNSERPTEYVVELNNLQGILTARAVTKETGFTDVINCNNSTFHLKRNSVIGTAVEIDEVILSDTAEADKSLSVRKSVTCSEESDDSKVAVKLPLV